MQPHPDIETRIRSSFARQGLMTTLGARLTHIASGEVVIELDYGEHITQQHAFVHGAAIAAIGDTACGYAALTLLPDDAEVLTVEYKINFVAPASGTKFRAKGMAKKPGRTLTVCTGDVFTISAEGEKLIATILATMMRVAT